MKKTAIIIPTRLAAKRFPNKHLARINNIPMIVHVLNQAKAANVGSVFVATPDEEILKVVKENYGNAVLTKSEHMSGSDRIYEVYKKELKNGVDLIINLQGDMPNIKPSSISKLENLMRRDKCEIGTLASKIEKRDFSNPNIVKVELDRSLADDDFLEARDFFRLKKDYKSDRVYHHIGIYAFTNTSLTKYVELKRSKLEIERNLEQMRALENDLKIKVGWSDSNPLSVDTQDDIEKINEQMK